MAESRRARVRASVREGVDHRKRGRRWISIEGILAVKQPRDSTHVKFTPRRRANHARASSLVTIEPLSNPYQGSSFAT